MSGARASRWGTWLPAGYLALVVASAAYLAYRLAFAPTNSEFAGMPLLLLSLPWSDWLGLLAGVGLNAAVLWLIGRGLDRVTDSRRPGPAA